jgi:hypothetical protein
MLREPLQTNNRLWVLGAVSVFVALGFVDHLAGATWKGDNSLWHYFGLLFEEQEGHNTEGLLFVILFSSLLRAVPAVLVGWVLQALVVAIWSSVRAALLLWFERNDQALESPPNAAPRSRR